MGVRVKEREAILEQIEIAFWKAFHACKGNPFEAFMAGLWAVWEFGRSRKKKVRDDS